MANEQQPSTTGILEEFRVQCWSRLPNKEFFLVLLALWLALFQFLGNSTLGYLNTPSLFKWMYASYQSGGSTAVADDAHGKYIPLLVLGLFWWKRNELLALRLRTWPPALLLIVFGLLVHVAGYAVQQPRVSIVGMFVGLFGLLGLAWGPGFLRHSLFPFFLFTFSVPLGSLTEAITFPLRLLVCQLVEIVCHYLLAIDIIRNGTALSDPSNQYQYDVAAACSGIRSLVAISLIATIYAFLSFKSLGKRVILMGAAVPLAVLGNLLRMLIIIIAAEFGGQEWGKWAHENWVMSLTPYIPAILGLMWLGRLLEGGRGSPPDRRPPEAAIDEPAAKGMS